MLVYDENGVKVFFMPLAAYGKGERCHAERAAVDALICEAFAGAEVPRLEHHSSGAPCLAGVDVTVSVSHCSEGVCVALGYSGVNVGIDAESSNRGGQLRRVAGKFLSREQMDVWGVDESSLLRAWTIKEAIYKAALQPGLPLVEIPLPAEIPADNATVRLHGKMYSIIILGINEFYGDVTLVKEIACADHLA